MKVNFSKFREMGRSLQGSILIKCEWYREDEHEFFEVTALAQNWKDIMWCDRSVQIQVCKARTWEFERIVVQDYGRFYTDDREVRQVGGKRKVENIGLWIPSASEDKSF